MSYPWRTLFVTSTWTLLGHPRRGLESTGIIPRAEEPELAITKEQAAGAATSIIVGVIFCLFLVSLLGLAVFYFFKRMRQRATDVESSSTEQEKKNWWMVTDKDEKKGGLADWWRQSHYSIPDRVEPPPSANPRFSLQRLRSALTRKGALRTHTKNSSEEDSTALLSKFFGKAGVTSPTQTIVLPMQTVPQPKPRYPSVLERGYRVPLYPIQSPPEHNSPPRSLTSPAPPPPLPSLPALATIQEHQLDQRTAVPERLVRKKLTPPPRALKISSIRPLVPVSERKMGHPRSPAHRRRGMGNQLKHPFLPFKDSDTAFPTISAPMPSAETARTNPKLGYAYSMSKPRSAPMAPGGPRQLGRVQTRRIPVPVFESKPARPLLPATPLHLREDVRVLPPGLSPSIRPTPTPI